MTSCSIKRLARRVVWAASIAVSLGCSQSPYELAPVRGTVTLDRVPLPGGRVMFAPIAASPSPDAGKPAFGQLQPDGSFTLTTFREGDGAIVGEHWVTVYGPSPEAPQANGAGKAWFKRLAVPRKQAVVAGEDNDIHIELTRQDVARFSLEE
jgi:hypothetical protein